MAMYAPLSHYNPQFPVSSRRPLIMWLFVATCSLAITALIVAAPLAAASGHGLVGLTIYQAFSVVCHQIPERSFFIAGHKFAVCARCTGIYSGFAAMVLAYPLVKPLCSIQTPARKWLFIAAAPLAIDFGLGFLGIWENTHLSRFLTGALLGAVAVFYVMPGLVELSTQNWRALFARSERRRTAGRIRAQTFPENTAPSDYSAPHRRI
jgi:uncharacterized membrane protein